MKVIITCTFCYDNLWESNGSEKPGKLEDFFLLLCGQPVILSSKVQWKIIVIIVIIIYSIIFVVVVNALYTCYCVGVIAGVQHIDGPLQVKYWGPDPCGVDAYVSTDVIKWYLCWLVG